MRFFIVLIFGTLAMASSLGAVDNNQTMDDRQLKVIYDDGIGYLDSEKYDQAIESFQRILEVRPNMAPIHNLLGVAYLRQGSTTMAINAFEEAGKSDPHFAEAFYNLGQVYLHGDSKDINAVIGYYEKAIAADPTFLKAYVDLGWIYLSGINEPQKAVAFFEKAARLAPNSENVYLGLGMAYAKTNQRALALNPISKLRSMRRDDMALMVESAMRGSDTPSSQSDIESPPFAGDASTDQQVL